MSEILKEIDERTQLAGTNKLEVLLFTLGHYAETRRCELFGINVFKVREVIRTPEITRAPDMPRAVVGMVSLRGQLVPVIDLATYAGMETDAPREIMIVTEYNSSIQGFLVASVEHILRLDWAAMKMPPPMVTAHLGGLVTAVSELGEGKLMMMIDVEKILADMDGDEPEAHFRDIKPIQRSDRTIMFADDSTVARKQIERTLQALNVRAHGAINGRIAWEELQRIADAAETAGRPVSEMVQLILTDVEMPEMDGYMLTRLVKGDPRFNGIPVIMHSSLSGDSNRQLGRSVGVDEYVTKFEPGRLAETLSRLLA